MAVRPLTLSELGIAINTTSSPSVGFSRDEVMGDQLSCCGYFVTIEEDQVGLIHQSATDYLLRKTRDSNPELEVFRIKEDVVNLEIARKCLNYLQDGALAAGEVDLQKNTSHLKAFPLLSYAALHWPEHAISLAPSEDIFDLSLSFYDKRSQIRDSWLKTYWAMKKPGHRPESFTLLHLASCFGIQPLAENLLRKEGLLSNLKLKFGMNKVDSEGKTALMWAAQGRHEAMVQLLLEKRADIEAKTRWGTTALYEAAQDGHEAVVRLLLEKGADVSVKDKLVSTALHGATHRGDEAVVQLLLEKGADVNAKDDLRSTPLHEAAKGGRKALVRLLLENGADLEAKNYYGMMALYKAAEGGDDGVVRLLLEKGADIEAKNSNGWTALQAAFEGGYEAVVRLLLEKGRI